MKNQKFMGVPLHVICCFPLATFNIFYLSLIFVILITMCLGMFLFGVILFGTLHYLDLGDCCLSQVREVFSCYVFIYVLSPFLSLFFWDPCNANIDVLDVVPEVCLTVLLSLFVLSLGVFTSLKSTT